MVGAMKVHRHPVRVYYEDTDLAGYRLLRQLPAVSRTRPFRNGARGGISQLEMKAKGFVFAVRRVEADYLKPAHFEDELIVETRASGLKGASFDMPQRVLAARRSCWRRW
jgi:acyl-CoA thioester hydrolase